MVCASKEYVARWLRWSMFLVASASLSALAVAPGASADTAPIPTSAGLPWADPAHQSPLEVLASRIASHIAGRPVSVDCESTSEWTALVSGLDGNPAAESGFVATEWDGTTGALLSLSDVADLSSDICGPLSDFAMATTKPTKCSPSVSFAPAKHMIRARAARQTVQAPGPCYLGAGKTAAAMTPAFWARYAADAIAILTLAHESIHLGGVVGGTLSNGLAVGDPQAEAKADCYGMQWMPYVAEELGDTPDDAQAIATYFWDTIYPLSRPSHPAYWSPECRAGGLLDGRPTGATAWP
jgi:hypothetical protein